jgi:hypothetical protein
LGSPLESLTHKSLWLQQEINKCLNNKFIEKWSDFYSDQDWFCYKAPIKDTNKTEFTALSLRVSWLKQINGESHYAYFLTQKCWKKL